MTNRTFKQVKVKDLKVGDILVIEVTLDFKDIPTTFFHWKIEAIEKPTSNVKCVYVHFEGVEEFIFTSIEQNAKIVCYETNKEG